MCDDKPTVDNSLPAKHLTENSSPDNSLLSGFSLQYICENNFRQNTNITTCRDDGKWTPTVQCYRGSSKQILISLKLFSVDIQCCFDKVRNLFLSVIVLFQSEYIHFYFESYLEKIAVIYWHLESNIFYKLELLCSFLRIEKYLLYIFRHHKVK